MFATLQKNTTSQDVFASLVFTPSVMEKVLPKIVYNNIMGAISGKEKIKPEYADTIAVAMQEWAIGNGATHFCHWFQPLTGLTAEKHDSFLEWKGSDAVIEKFGGHQLIQGEPDASSFPSGGLRSTYEARGYTGWDPTSPAFLWKSGSGITLCIPSVFFSWTGDVLDTKIPLLRSDIKLNQAVLRLLRLSGSKAQRVFSTLGWEQEYFVVDRELRDQRMDLVLLGETVYGAPCAKGQDLQDHYFGVVKERILKYMQDFESKAIEIGIPVKTRHNEVAPAQHEIACVYEQAARSVDHNLLMMELMRRVAADHGLSCLFHEKPFKGLNGSGKHNNWSLGTDLGENLLNPHQHAENPVMFVLLLTAILDAVHKHSDLLKASIGSYSNDARLGGHEAPPAIISVYLGPVLDQLLNKIEKQDWSVDPKIVRSYDLGISQIPDLSKDEMDRNRTSPFAFTGNKFEFRAVGASASCAFPITVINAIVAESVNSLVDEIEMALNKKKGISKKEFMQAVMPIVAHHLAASRSIRFLGDNYSDEWKLEAQKRGLSIETCSLNYFDALDSQSTVKAFEGILDHHELTCRKEVAFEDYHNRFSIKVKLMLQLLTTQIIPACQKQLIAEMGLIQMAHTLGGFSIKKQEEKAKKLAQQIEIALEKSEQLAQLFKDYENQSVHRKNELCAQKMRGLCHLLRQEVDILETLVDDAVWPLPKYQELLFLL